jgi:hypothetical protein
VEKYAILAYFVLIVKWGIMVDLGEKVDNNVIVVGNCGKVCR